VQLSSELWWMVRNVQYIQHGAACSIGLTQPHQLRMLQASPNFCPLSHNKVPDHGCLINTPHNVHNLPPAVATEASLRLTTADYSLMVTTHPPHLPNVSSFHNADHKPPSLLQWQRRSKVDTGCPKTACVFAMQHNGARSLAGKSAGWLLNSQGIPPFRLMDRSRIHTIVT
jgi:hypothetical protein